MPKKRKTKKSDALTNFYKVIFYVFLAMTILMYFVDEITKIQQAPFLLFVIFAYFYLFEKKLKFNIAIGVLAVLMIIFNSASPPIAWLDVIMWACACTFLFSKNK